MTDKFEWKLVGAWNAYQKAIDPAALEARLDRYLGVAADRIGRQFVQRAQKAIKARKYAPNSPLTVILKGGQSTPLVGRGGGDLLQSITYDATNPYQVKLGVLRQKAGEEVTNLAIILHEGATIDLEEHPGVRAAVWAKVRDAMGTRASTRAAKASRQKAISQLASPGMKAAAKVWKIPPRPFIAEPLMDKSFQAFAVREWKAALETALFGKAKGKTKKGDG